MATSESHQTRCAHLCRSAAVAVCSDVAAILDGGRAVTLLAVTDLKQSVLQPAEALFAKPPSSAGQRAPNKSTRQAADASRGGDVLSAKNGSANPSRTQVNSEPPSGPAAPSAAGLPRARVRESETESAALRRSPSQTLETTAAASGTSPVHAAGKQKANGSTLGTQRKRPPGRRNQLHCAVRKLFFFQVRCFRQLMNQIV